jgi:hypothetical protein
MFYYDRGTGAAKNVGGYTAQELGKKHLQELHEKLERVSRILQGQDMCSYAKCSSAKVASHAEVSRTSCWRKSFKVRIFGLPFFLAPNMML